MMSVEARAMASGLKCRVEVTRVLVCLGVLFASSPDLSGALLRCQKSQLGVLTARFITGAPYVHIGMARGASKHH